MEAPSKGYFRYYPPIGDNPGSRVRLRHGYVTECVGYDKDENGKVIAVHVKYFEDSKSGTPGSDNYKVKGNIHWVSAQAALEAEVRLYDRLFTDAQPDAGGKDFISLLNPNAKEVVRAYLEPGMSAAQADQRFQFERHLLELRLRAFFHRQFRHSADHPHPPIFRARIGVTARLSSASLTGLCARASHDRRPWRTPYRDREAPYGAGDHP
jgi:hypothetical protein